jgi:hypothetical protein
MSKDNIYFFELQKVKVDIQSSIQSLTEIEQVNRDRLRRADSCGYSNVLFPKNEISSHIDLLGDIHWNLTSNYQALIQCLRHHEIQNKILEHFALLELDRILNLKPNQAKR